jgi:glycosyltransferase involved in cell wall biosynthesis
MKVFFVIKSLHIAAGTERATVVIANELAQRNYEVGIICLANEGKSFFEINSKVQLHYLYNEQDKRASLVRDVSRRIKLRQLYKQEKPDLIIIVGSGRSMLNIPAARGIPSITWEHFNVNVNWHLLHPLSRKLAAMYSNKIVTLTKQDAKNYKNKFRAKNVVCIPNPITIDSTNKSPLTEKRVLAIGRLTKQKGFDLLLEAWNKVQNKDNGWKLRIIGSGGMLSFLSDKIKEYNLSESIELVPSSDDVIAHYQAASIYVMSSRYEGLPLVLIEAMAMGLPIVSFDCETGPRDIIEDNVTGRLVPAFDVNKLALELDNLMNNEPKRKFFSDNAIKSAKKFDTGIIVDKWERLFHEIITNKG